MIEAQQQPPSARTYASRGTFRISRPIVTDAVTIGVIRADASALINSLRLLDEENKLSPPHHHGGPSIKRQ